jgi:hypothetical protein
MDGSLRQAIRTAVDDKVRQQLKSGRGRKSAERLTTGSWIPILEKVQRQHIFSAIRTEHGSYQD